MIVPIKVAKEFRSLKPKILVHFLDVTILYEYSQAWTLTQPVPCSAQRVSSPAHTGSELAEGAAVRGKGTGTFEPF